MKTKQEILADIQEGLGSGAITEADLKTFITVPQPQPAQTEVDPPEEQKSKPEKLSAVDVLFYIAGIVLFAAIMSMIVQSWEEGSPLVHILLSAGIGAGMWSLAYYLIKNPLQNDVRKGLTNSLLLTGSLLVVSGGYIITNELIGGYEELNLIPGAIMLVVIGAIHLLFDKLIKKDFILLLGLLLCVLSFPTLLFGILQGQDVAMDVWSIILIVTAGTLAYSTRVVAKIMPDRQKLKNAFDSLASIIGLGAMYASSFGDTGIIWLIILIAGVFGIFYLSIVSQDKRLLGSASFFMVLTVITISFQYFSGFGITVSLVMATIGLLGSAAVASGINKKYFKPKS